MFAPAQKLTAALTAAALAGSSLLTGCCTGSDHPARTARTEDPHPAIDLSNARLAQGLPGSSAQNAADAAFLLGVNAVFYGIVALTGHRDSASDTHSESPTEDNYRQAARN